METESDSNASSTQIVLVGVDPGEVPVLTARLRSWGHQVCAAVPSGQEAVERAAALRPDLALIDVERAAGVGADRIASLLAVPSVYLVGHGAQALPPPASFPYAWVLKPPNDGQLRLNIDAVLASHARERRSREESARAISTLKRKLADLQDRHAFAHTALDTMTEGVVLTGRDGTFRLINRAALATFDSDPDEDPHKWLERLEVLESDEATPVAEADFPIRRTLDGQSVNGRRLFVRDRRSGVGTHLSISTRPVHDAEGRLDGSILVFRDVTAQKRTEARLEETDARLQNQVDLMETVFDSMAEGVVVVGADRGVVVFNPSARRILGLPDSVPDFRDWNRDDYLYHADGVTPLARDEYPLVAALRGESTNEMDLYLPGPDIYVSAHAAPLHDKLGRLRGAVSVFRDSTPLKKAEQSLQRAVTDLQQQNRFRETVFQSISDGVVASDRDGTLTLVNRSAEELLGRRLARGDDAASVFDGAFFRDESTSVPRDETPLWRALQGESTTGMEMFLRAAPDSEGIHISASAGPMRDASGDLTGAVVTFHDVTQRVHAREALLQAFAHGRTEIIDSVLHNIGNAINSVAVGADTLAQQLGDDEVLCRFCALADSVAEHEGDWIEWLRSDPQGRQVRPFLLALVSDLQKRNESLNGTARRVSDRVRHIVDIIRNQESFTTARVWRKTIDLREAIADAVKTLRDSLDKRAIVVEVDCERAPSQILVQESQFHQMLVNLVKNAMEAIDALVSTGHELVPGPRIRVTAWSEADHVALDVTDNGIGVAPESMQEIFTAGYTTKESGTGLGLHSAANFVVGSGGTIEPLSEGIGRGATMRVRLRLSQNAGRRGRPARE
ncbi:MAG: PAS domain-containing protein [Acidobacteria bacterium]|nr:PAS domain-containing protein [Acidobacteriota bacterium]